jgi:hypothetical protein
MSRLHGRLTAGAVKFANERGIFGDGGGLYLQVARGGSRSWVLRYRLGGRRRHLGLGGFPSVSLAEARERASTARAMLREGKDPVAVKAGQRVAVMLAAAKAMTFAQAATAYLEAHAAAMRPKTAEQWRQTIASHMIPVIGALPVRAIDTPAVMRVLTPLWSTKTETASRTRARIETPSLTGRKWPAIAMARTRRAGTGTSSSSCRPRPRSPRCSITRLCRTPNCRPSWPRRDASPALWSSRS